MFNLLNIFSNPKIIESGGAFVEKFNIKFYKKKYTKFEEKEYEKADPFSVNNKIHYLNEVKYLTLLESYDICPKIIEKNENSLILTDCGETLCPLNIPENWKDQITNIFEIFKKEKIYHNDIKFENFTVKNGNIYIIDFGWTSQHSPSYPYLNIYLETIQKSATIKEMFHHIANHSSNITITMCNNLNQYINNNLRSQLL